MMTRSCFVKEQGIHVLYSKMVETCVDMVAGIYDLNCFKFLCLKAFFTLFNTDVPNVRRPAYVTIMVAEVLVPNTHQVICAHRDDLTS